MADGLLGIPHIAYAKAQVNRSKSLDLSKLDVGFGGFAPTLLNDGESARENVLSAEARIRERCEAAERAQARKTRIPPNFDIMWIKPERIGNTSYCRSPPSVSSVV